MPAESVNIRLAQDHESNELLELYNSSRADVGCYSRQAVELTTFLTLVEGEEIHLALMDERIVGFVSVWVADRFIHHLYILSEYQSRGVGSALLKTCEEKYGLPLSLKCDTCNYRAQRFYRRKGWQPKRTGVGEDGPWDHFYSPCI